VARARRPVAPEVHRVLVEQNSRLAPSRARDTHLAALAAGAAAVVTGQQVGLFLGPLYTLYKAASAIVIARTLAAETGMPVVPIFWLQTEDHDLAEIATCEVASGDRCETVAVAVDAANRVSIAHLTLPDSIEGALATLADLLGTGPEAIAHVERVRRHYSAGARWSDAFAGLLAELFSDEGLVVIDPRDPSLAAVVAPVHVRAITDAAEISGSLLATSDELTRAGRVVPIHVRPGSPLSFFHPDGPTGPRVRLEPAGAPSSSPPSKDLPSSDAFVEVGGERRFDLATLLAADPRCFSTSAALRPIVQDTLLPTAAYVGGPAEVAYFAQLPSLYRAFDRPMPLIIERSHFRIVDERSRRRLARLGVTAAQLEGCSEADLLARARPAVGTVASVHCDDLVGEPANTGDASARRDDLVGEPAAGTSDASVGRDGVTGGHPDGSVDDAASQLLTSFLAAHDAVAARTTSPAITRALAKTRVSVERSLQKFAAKVERIAAYDDAELVDAVRRVRAWLAPDGDLQERRLGLPCFAARLGDRAVVERVLAAALPFDPSIQELS
jgi:bacillithiol biosynthesis cysteine-adding enzyme BshC